MPIAVQSPIVTVTGFTAAGEPVRLKLVSARVEVDRLTRRARIRAFQQAELARLRQENGPDSEAEAV